MKDLIKKYELKAVLLLEIITNPDSTDDVVKRALSYRGLITELIESLKELFLSDVCGQIKCSDIAHDYIYIDDCKDDSFTELIKYSNEAVIATKHLISALDMHKYNNSEYKKGEKHISSGYFNKDKHKETCKKNKMKRKRKKRN